MQMVTLRSVFVTLAQIQELMSPTVILVLFDSFIQTHWILFCSYVKIKELQNKFNITYYKHNLDAIVNGFAAFIKIIRAHLNTSIINFKYWLSYYPLIIKTGDTPCSNMKIY